MKGLLTNDYTGNTSSLNTGFLLTLVTVLILLIAYVTGRIEELPEWLPNVLYAAFAGKGFTSVGQHLAGSLKKPEELEAKIKDLYLAVKRTDGNYKGLAKKINKAVVNKP